MKLSWTFYPKGEDQSVTLTVVYVPALDAEQLSSGGFVSVNTNVAYVDWATYKRFDSADVESRRDAYRRLTPIARDSEVIIAGKQIGFSNE